MGNETEESQDYGESVDVGWDNLTRSGAFLCLRSSNYSNQEGRFILMAQDSSKVSALLGTPDGELKWRGHGSNDFIISDIPNTYLNKSGGTLTGTISFDNSTHRLDTIKNLTNENVSTDATHFLGLKSDWSKVGYVSSSDALSVLGLTYGEIGLSFNTSALNDYNVHGYHIGKMVFITGYISAHNSGSALTLVGSSYIAKYLARAPIYSGPNTGLDGVIGEVKIDADSSSLQFSLPTHSTTTYQYFNICYIGK